jgi:hypothetical protein
MRRAASMGVALALALPMAALANPAPDPATKPDPQIAQLQAQVTQLQGQLQQAYIVARLLETQRDTALKSVQDAEVQRLLVAMTPQSPQGSQAAKHK